MAGDIDIPAEVVTAAAAEAIEDAAIRHLGRDLGTIHRDDIVRAGLAAVVPLIRAQVAAELRTCQETAASLLANDDHLHECEREAGHRSPRHRCPCGCEWWPMVEWERPVITPALPSTVAAPVTVHRGEDFPGPDEDFAEPDEDPADGYEARQREER